jgi:hypothetical protein
MREPSTRLHQPSRIGMQFVKDRDAQHLDSERRSAIWHAWHATQAPPPDDDPMTMITAISDVKNPPLCRSEVTSRGIPTTRTTTYPLRPQPTLNLKLILTPTFGKHASTKN